MVGIHRNWRYVLIGLIVATSLILLEAAWSKRKGREIYDRAETIQNLLIFVGMRLSGLVLSGWALESFRFFQRLSSQAATPTAASFGLAVLLFDFLYYWQHRLFHGVSFLWPFHEVHHQAHHFNLSAALRLPWINSLISPLFFAPLAILGFPVPQILGAAGINLLYQFLLHTELVPRIPGIEGILNTPSAHRVHHSSNPCYQDKNLGGVLLIWDRIFGTYAAERADVPRRYGVSGDSSRRGVLGSVFGGFARLRAPASWRQTLLRAAYDGRGLIAFWFISCAWVCLR